MQSSMTELKSVFVEALGIPADLVTEDLAYNSHPRWDSTAHLQLVMALEARYGCTLETEDMLDMSSVARAAEILSKYGVVCA